MKPKNLLFLFSDEHTRRALGCYGHAVVKTPHLDALAARGVRFTDAYTPCPICVPARASLATGQYVCDIGYWDNAKPYEGGVPSWHERLNAAGVRCDSIGKLHYRATTDPNGFYEEVLPLHVVDGKGDLLGVVRDRGAVLTKYRGYIEESGGGESTYTEYDRNITGAAVQWLQETAPWLEQPWALFVSLVAPHPPNIAPQAFYDLYPPEKMPWPLAHDPDVRPRHPVMEDLRRFMGIEEPFGEDVVRRAVAAYFGLCSFLDDNLGRILRALEEQGLADDTRIVYTSDHGEENGDRGAWGKCNMYEESAGVPLIMAGPDVPRGKVCRTPVNLVDLFPTALECVGLPLNPEDRHLPGRSLLQIANEPDDPGRVAYSEFHAAASNTGGFMLRKGRWKYVRYVGYPAQLFDLEADPDELDDLGADPAHRVTREMLECELRRICDPEDVDARARRDQALRLAAAGGRDAVVARGAFGYTPAPGEAVVYE